MGSMMNKDNYWVQLSDGNVDDKDTCTLCAKVDLSCKEIGQFFDQIIIKRGYNEGYSLHLCPYLTQDEAYMKEDNGYWTIGQGRTSDMGSNVKI